MKKKKRTKIFLHETNKKKQGKNREIKWKKKSK